MPKACQSDMNNTLAQRATQTWIGELRDLHILASPPVRQDGVASMLIALGDAGIGVSQAEPEADDSGMYRLTVSDDPERALDILESIGCLAIRSINYSIARQVTQGSPSLNNGTG